MFLNEICAPIRFWLDLVHQILVITEERALVFLFIGLFDHMASHGMVGGMEQSGRVIYDPILIKGSSGIRKFYSAKVLYQ